MTSPNSTPPAAPPTGRLVVGGVIFVAGFLAPLLIPLVAVLPLPGGWKAPLSALLALGIPELGMLVAVAVMGKPGFAFLKMRLFRVVRQYGPPADVGPTRYRVGMVLFALPLLVAWATPYAPYVLHGFDPNRLDVAVAGDVLLLASLIMLGGDFWDKLRSLFVYGSRAQFPVR